MFKAVKVRLYPTPAQQHALACQFGAVRWVYNHALEWRCTAWRERQENVTLRMTLDQLVELKRQPETVWLRDADSQALQQAMRHLDDAFTRFFRKQSRYPRFKRRFGKQSMAYPQRVNVVEGNRLYLPKVGGVKAVLHRELVGTIKTVTVSRSPSGKYYASILCDDGKELPQPDRHIDEDNVVGVDLGLTHLAITSEGVKLPNPRCLEKGMRNLRRKQKALSRKQRGSANRNKARLLVAKAHERIANQRHDAQHKLSRQLMDENQVICVETLRVTNMLKNRRLSKAISDAAWGELVRKLRYKATWHGKHVVFVDTWFPSSKQCSACGEVVSELPLSVRTWTCPTCHHRHDRDVNAALNIKAEGILKLKAAGLSVSACGGLRKTGEWPAVAREAGSPFLEGGEQSHLIGLCLLKDAFCRPI